MIVIDVLSSGVAGGEGMSSVFRLTDVSHFTDATDSDLSNMYRQKLST